METRGRNTSVLKFESNREYCSDIAIPGMYGTLLALRPKHDLIPDNVGVGWQSSSTSKGLRITTVLMALWRASREALKLGQGARLVH
jgi:hypothetical protein